MSPAARESNKSLPKGEPVASIETLCGKVSPIPILIHKKKILQNATNVSTIKSPFDIS
jgi:hypothetical protein